MKTIRLLFNDAMARAIVDGRKTVTRRPIFDVFGGFPPTDAVFRELRTSARNDFLCAWDDIYLNRGLASAVNPWVWRIEFGAENAEATL